MNEQLFGEELVRPQADVDAWNRIRDQVLDILLDQAASATKHFVLNSTASDMHTAEELVSAFAAFQRFDRDTHERVCLHPTFQYWLKAMRRCVYDEDADRYAACAMQFPSLIWSEEAVLPGGMAASRPAITDYRGGLRCPSLGAFVEFGVERAATPVTIEPKGDRSTLGVTFPDGETIKFSVSEFESGTQGRTGEKPGYAVRKGRRLSPWDIELSARDSWLRVDFTWTHQRSDGVNFFGVSDELVNDDASAAPYQAALEHIQASWPEALCELSNITRVIVPLNSRSEQRLAFTVSSRQGAIFLDEDEPSAMAENIVHENAHVKLRMLQLLDPLLVDLHQDEPRFSVPWRSDPRPLPGILEGVFVFSHVAELERRRVAASPNRSAEYLSKLLANIDVGVSALNRNAQLTACGQVFMDSIRAWLDDLRLVVA